jgi:pyruvate/2-oxoglutarate/acetoin dehydrogenase E1 component
VAEPSGKKVKLTNREALNLAMSEELDRDSRVFLIGE